MTILVTRPPKAPPTAAPAPSPGGMLPFIPGGGLSGGGIPIVAGQFIPPNGLAGFAQQTPAVQSLYRGRRNGTKRRRASTAKASGTTRRRKKKAVGAAKRSAKRGAKRLVKGSAAAKRYMAKIRRMRK